MSPRRRCAIETLEPRQMLDAGLVISEFMAVNNATLADENGEFSDWIEIHNPTTEAVNLDGWYLTDDEGDLSKWQFPARSLGPNEYLVAFASDKDRAAAQGELHTNFKLSSGGDYLALVEPDGTTVAHAYAPEYPNQTADVSYGLGPVVPTVLLDEQADVAFLVPTADDATLATAWTASDFDDTTWSQFDRVSSVLITEAATGSPDFVEIQNVSSETVTTTGWVVAVNDASAFNINAVVPTTWQLGASMPAGEVLYRTNATDDNYWGETFVWVTQGPGWVMIVDDAGTVQDFVVWGYGSASLESFRVDVNGSTITSADIWKENAVSAGGGRDNSLQRHGTADHDHASDWAFVDDQSKGTPNANLAISIPGTPKTGVGFSLSAPGFGDAIQTDVAGEMHGVNASLWTRIEFNVDDPNSLDTLLLGMKYDDGFVAYLNGIEIARRNAPGAEGTVPAYNASATATHPNEDAVTFEAIDVTTDLAALQTGTNVLSIHGLNASASDDDFLLLPWLEASMIDPDPQVGVMVEPTPREQNSTVISATPTVSIPGRTFTGSLEVEISVATPRTTIHYTVDGSRPTAASPIYAGPITLDTTAEIRALAVQEGYDPSNVVGEAYVRLASDVVAFDSNLPILIVDSFGGATANRNTMGDFHLTVFEPDAVTGRTTLTAEAELSARLGLKIRGSSSAGFPKKQYRVEARDQDDQDDDVRLLGMPSESDWVFGAPYTDKALIRNSLAFDLGREVGLEAPGTRHVELFYNENGGDLRASDYMGVYFVAEAIKIGDNRLDIAELVPEDVAEPDITGGYLIRFDGGRAIAADTLGGWNSLEFVNAEDYNTQQRQWMSSFVTEFHNNLHGPNYADPDTGYAQYIDVASFVNLMVVNELTRDQDAYVRSNFLYKDREGLLTQGPLWDYNLIMGTGCCFNNRDTHGWQYEHPYNRGLQQNRGDDPDWIVRLMSDPDFAIQFRDRWFELRQGLLSLDALYDRIHVHADPLAEAAVRNFQKWNILGSSNPGFPSPVTSTWQQQIEFILDRDAPGQYTGWLADRIAWIDGQLLSLTPPVFSQAGGEVAPGFELTLGAAAGTIYYTLDGADPRAPGGAVNLDSAVEYTGAVELTDPVVVKARVLSGGTWSAVNEAFFLVGVAASAENLVISEINYNPYPPTAAELEVDSDWTAEDFEFVELRNVGPHTVKLDEVAFVDGIDHTIEAGSVTTLNHGELLVLARNPAAYAVRYPDAPTPTASYLGKLSNGGEEIELHDFQGGRILRFEYDDSGAWPGRADGKGASLELIEPDSVPAAEPARSEYLDDADHWQSSVAYGGTP
ncbi:MAG: CotH kinase family protein, partial [Candidatus Nealsonbacteria bacterium]|nr:CotH kinase family protein [Candidatus Nealsonbacteria bacterium]